ncbi:flavoprotein [Micromonospora aurantiaca]|uniref:Flavoprotein n=1 Tax=Micromonospora aurantiaca (nom. illeg.) TaxID=47850 RepID=A0ABQ6UBC7_9ACTN|nr:flavoprotein [Micromonospora aurantiaca]KAB1108118.1 flavoprotein [Micromonospora aurantiaca]UFN95660.1 flavoprotein [Micromonospora aurantiaca]
MSEAPVLYLVVCAAPPAQQIGELADLLMADGWRICVIATPIAASWLDCDALADRTGYPVRAHWRRPGDPEPHPPADGAAVVPATFNTLNKWAAGVSDTLALGILNELLCTGVPIHVFPRVKATLAAHPAYGPNLRRLRKAGVVVHDGDVLRAPDEMTSSRWAAVVDALRAARPGA